MHHGSRHIQAFTATKISINFVHLRFLPEVVIPKISQYVISAQHVSGLGAAADRGLPIYKDTDCPHEFSQTKTLGDCGGPKDHLIVAG